MSDPAENRDVRGNKIKPHSVEAENVNANSVNTDEQVNGQVIEKLEGYSDIGEAIQNALDSLPSTGGTVVAKDAADWSTPVTVDKPVKIVGPGFGNEIAGQITDGSDYLTVNQKESVSIGGFRVNGTGSDGDLVRLDGTTASGTASRWHVLFRIHGWSLGGRTVTAEGTVFGCLFEHVFSSGCDGGGFKLFEGGSPSAGPPSANDLVNVHVTSVGNVDGIDAIYVGSDATLVGCTATMSDNGRDAFHLIGQGKTVIACEAEKIGRHGLYTTGQELTIRGLLIGRTGQNTAHTGDGILFDGNNRRNSIAGVNIQNAERYGINSPSGTAADISEVTKTDVVAAGTANYNDPDGDITRHGAFFLEPATGDLRAQDGGGNSRFFAPQSSPTFIRADDGSNGLRVLTTVVDSEKPHRLKAGYGVNSTSDLSIETGDFDGQVKRDDGTNTLQSGEPMWWDNSASVWRSFSDPTVTA